MDIRGLGYIGIDVADVAGWRAYADCWAPWWSRTETACA